jgi:endonuclease-3 related protein
MINGIQSLHDKLIRIYDLLLARYGPRRWWPAETPFEVCVGAILTQNTNWGNVEKAIAGLKREGSLAPGALRAIPVERLAELIRPAGYYNLKSERLKSFIEWLFIKYGGSVERMSKKDWRELRGELLAVRGIGPETADSILLYACGKPTFVVDAYTKRLLAGLGLISGKESYEEVRSLFMENLPPDVPLFNEFHALIVQHAKEHCRKRPICPGCPLHFCPAGGCLVGIESIAS